MASVSEVVAHMLRQEGIGHIFGLPGGENLVMMEAARKAGIRYVLAKREGTAAFMADMYGQLTGRPGVCMSTLGPGSTNLVNGVANAYLDRSPLLAITAQVGTGRLETWTHQKRAPPAPVPPDYQDERPLEPGRVTVDVGSHKMLVSQLWQARRPHTVFQSNGLSAMGFAVPAAITAAMVAPERPALCLTGDGGFAMSLSELEVAIQHKLPVVFVVFNDGSLNRIEIKQQEANYPIIGTRTLKAPYARVAEAYGAHGIHADDAAALEAALAEARAVKDGPVVIEAAIDPAEYRLQF